MIRKILVVAAGAVFLALAACADPADAAPVDTEAIITASDYDLFSDLPVPTITEEKRQVGSLDVSDGLTITGDGDRPHRLRPDLIAIGGQAPTPDTARANRDRWRVSTA